MIETKATLESPVREQNASTSAPQWIIRVIRCRTCQELARESDRKRVSDDETVVHFECSYCGGHQTRHYFDNPLSL